MARVLLSGRLDARLQRDVALEKNIVVKVNIEGVIGEAQPDELLIDLVNRAGASVPHVATTLN